MDLREHLTALCTTPGLSAYETPVRALIEETWRPWVNEIDGDRLGSLWGIRHGSGREPRRRIMLAAHMDAIGMMVRRVQDGFLELTAIGGIDDRVLPGSLVEVHAAGRAKPLAGVVVSIPPHLQKSANRSDVTPLGKLYVDVGLPTADVARAVHIGDLVTFAQPPTALGDGMLVANSLDNRAAVATLSRCLEALQGRPHEWDVVAVATVQEEVTYGGAFSSTFGIQPDIAIAIDVTWARQPGLQAWQTFISGEGPTVGWGPNQHPKLHALLQDTARELELPLHQEFLPRPGGTDSFAIQISRAGIPTADIGLPLKNMHTPVEMVSLRDLQRAARLIAEFITRLNGETMAKLALDGAEESERES
ncbi:MAG: M20/M25/M40 family metallo-hydrolase [Anaerolineales bacterium]